MALISDLAAVNFLKDWNNGYKPCLSTRNSGSAIVLPDGKVLPHPALVVSCDDLQDLEPGLFYAALVSSKNIIPELTIPIQSEWLSSPLPKASYFVTHIVSPFNVEDVISRHNCFLRQPYFDQVVDKIIANVVDGDFS